VGCYGLKTVQAGDGERFDAQTTVEMIVAGLPEMAKYLASIPDAQKAVALRALEDHYLKTVKDLDYSGRARKGVGSRLHRPSARTTRRNQRAFSAFCRGRRSERELWPRG
jgi:hypothetical protein